jgi:5,6-dimethylbenzimidazole synthase
MQLRDAIFTRRDTRHFTSAAIPDDVIANALAAAHAAPSVGLSQPWRFVLVKSVEVKQQIKALFDDANQKALRQLQENERAEKYGNLKLEGILEAPLGMFVFCEQPPEDEFILGTITQRDTLTWSVACAIQNFWLSLTEAGFSMGWVSIIDMTRLSEIIDVPANFHPLGYFCIGQPADDYQGIPMLERDQWAEPKAGPWVKWV